MKQTFRECKTVALGVEQPADLRKLAVALHLVVNGGGLGDIRVVGGFHPLYAFFAIRDEGRIRVGLHKTPHFLERWIGRGLRENKAGANIIEYNYHITSRESQNINLE